MALLPVIDEEVVNEFEYTQEPGHTYRMKVDQEDGTAGQVIGYVDGRDAVEQAVYKILNTERGENEIYRGQYGVEFDDLVGLPIPYVVPEVERRIKEALLMDDRITGAVNFSFDIPRRGVLHVSFSVTSIYGDITINQDIEVA
jgi:phage baseplate assembly protein W